MEAPCRAMHAPGNFPRVGEEESAVQDGHALVLLALLGQGSPGVVVAEGQGLSSCSCAAPRWLSWCRSGSGEERTALAGCAMGLFERRGRAA